MTTIRRLVPALLLLAICDLHAQTTRVRSQAEEQPYIAQLAAIDTSLVPYFIAGTASMDSGSYINASNWFYLVLDKAPGFPPALRRKGWCDAKLGDINSGINQCNEAYTSDHSWESALMLINVYLLTPELHHDATLNYYHAFELIDQTAELEGMDKYQHTLMAIDAASRVNDTRKLDEYIKKGLADYPDSMPPHYYAALMNIYYQNWVSADDELKQAVELGLDPEVAKKLYEENIASELSFVLWKQRIMWTFFGWIIGLAALFLVGVVLSWTTLVKVEKQIAGGGPLLADGMRKVYRRIVNIAGIYYYLSLPFVLLLLLIALGGTIYLFGKIPIYFFFLILASGGVTIFFMLKTLIVKPKSQETGRVLKEEEAPLLFALSREVAADMKTRPVEEIRLSPHVDMAVYERGSWRAKMQDKATRVLIMGAGILNDFKVHEFRAILAHEYGHFSNRDTAGGSVAFRVRRDIHLYAYSLAVNGQARWWNLAYQFLRLYDFIFRRISHGATRLQEILADRAAADMYGAKSFEGGLMHVIAEDIKFNMIAGNEIKDAKNSRRAFSNLYTLPMRYKDKIEEGVREYMNKKTTNDDTHPCPNDRFRYVAGIRGLKFRESMQTVPELFKDWSAITAEQTRVVEEEWKGHPAPGM